MLTWENGCIYTSCPKRPTITCNNRRGGGAEGLATHYQLVMNDNLLTKIATWKKQNSKGKPNPFSTYCRRIWGPKGWTSLEGILTNISEWLRPGSHMSHHL